MADGMLRNTAPAPRFWLKALTRKRASLGISKEKSVSKNSSYALRCLSFMMSYTMPCTSLWASAGMLMRFMSPSTRIIGGTPEDRCRSEALFLTANASSCAMSTAIDAPWNSAVECRTSRVRACARARGQYSGGVHCQYVNGSAEFAGLHVQPSARTGRAGGAGRRAECATPSHFWPSARRSRAALLRAARCRARALRRELPAGGAGQDCAHSPDRELTWHFIGRLQANKTRAVAETFAWVHAVDRLKIAERLSRAAPLSRAAAECVPAGEHGR